MKMYEVKCSKCGKMTPANKCPQLLEIPICKSCYLNGLPTTNSVH